jgi:hypothetical protein
LPRILVMSGIRRVMVVVAWRPGSHDAEGDNPSGANDPDGCLHISYL